MSVSTAAAAGAMNHSKIRSLSAIFKGVLMEEDNAVSNLNMFGWVAGVGLEWKFWPGSNSWLLRGEWLHYDFGKVTNATNNPVLFGFFGFDNGNVRTTVDVARAALSYKF
jgi:hypothetical protein